MHRYNGQADPNEFAGALPISALTGKKAQWTWFNDGRAKSKEDKRKLLDELCE